MGQCSLAERIDIRNIVLLSTIGKDLGVLRIVPHGIGQLHHIIIAIVVPLVAILELDRIQAVITQFNPVNLERFGLPFNYDEGARRRHG